MEIVFVSSGSFVSGDQYTCDEDILKKIIQKFILNLKYKDKYNFKYTFKYRTYYAVQISPYGEILPYNQTQPSHGTGENEGIEIDF